MEHLLAVNNLHKVFPLKSQTFFGKAEQVYAVSGVNLSLRAGQTLGVVGESGCGKSTLGRLILRLIEPNTGEVHFAGKNILTLNNSELRRQRRDMQIIFQDPYSSLNPRVKVRSILAEPFIIHGEAGPELEKKIAELLTAVGMGADAMHKYPHEFSGGQRQRIGIARAVALRPKLIIADEPVSALDVSVQAQILNLLSDLRSQLGLSYIFIAHDLAVVEHISDVVAVMYLGKIVEHAAAELLYQQPRHPYTQALIKSVPQVDIGGGTRQREVLKGDVPSPIKPPSGCHFHPRCPIATAKCSVEVPQLRNVGTDKNIHLAACHYA